MRISDVVRVKGDSVITINPDAPVRDLLALLSKHGFGALVVSTDGSAVEGIVSERDVVRRLHSEGAGIIDSPVRDIMTSDVHTATHEAELDQLAGMMTERRIRHVPVVDAQGHLVAIVSIGDIVKSRLEELQHERDHLVDYINQ